MTFRAALQKGNSPATRGQHHHPRAGAGLLSIIRARTGQTLCSRDSPHPCLLPSTACTVSPGSHLHPSLVLSSLGLEQVETHSCQTPLALPRVPQQPEDSIYLGTIGTTQSKDQSMSGSVSQSHPPPMAHMVPTPAPEPRWAHAQGHQHSDTTPSREEAPRARDPNATRPWGRGQAKNPVLTPPSSSERC